MRIDTDGVGEMAARARRGGRGVGRKLLTAVLELAAGRAELLRHEERPWASITFSGTRHRLALRFAGGQAVAAGETFVAALPDHEFTLPNQLVADAAVVSVEHDMLPEPQMTVEAELLLLEDV